MTLSKQSLEFTDDHTPAFICNFTQHSEPFKHDAARWAQSRTGNQLQPFFEFDAERSADELRELVNILTHVPKRPLRRFKKFFKNKQALAQDAPFALISTERFFSEH
jgi:hypothetical protein